VTNVGGVDIPGPVYLVLDRLTRGVVLKHAGGLSEAHVRPRDPFVVLTTGPVAAGQSVMTTLTFAPAKGKHVARAVKFGAFVLAGPGVV
jgi:hypothetical protein